MVFAGVLANDKITENHDGDEAGVNEDRLGAEEAHVDATGRSFVGVVE